MVLRHFCSLSRVSKISSCFLFSFLHVVTCDFVERFDSGFLIVYFVNGNGFQCWRFGIS